MRFKPVKRWALVLATAFLASCATGNRMPEYTGADKTCISGTTANFLTFLIDDEAHVEIISMNGQVRGGNGEHCYEPGSKLVGIQSMKGMPSTFRGEFALDAKANVRYKVRAFHLYNPRSVLVTVSNDQGSDTLRFETGKDGRLRRTLPSP